MQPHEFDAHLDIADQVVTQYVASGSPIHKPPTQVQRAAIEAHTQLRRCHNAWQATPHAFTAAQVARLRDVTDRLLREVFQIYPQTPTLAEQTQALTQLRALVRLGEDWPSPDDDIMLDCDLPDDEGGFHIQVRHQGRWHAYKVSITWVDGVDGP
jgi:hypothetical protein